MKKVIFVFGMLAFFSAICAVPSLAFTPDLSTSIAQVDEATVTTKVNLPALLSRKSYRLGIRAGLISPTDTINVNKDSTFHVGLEFDAKLNENLDTGPRFSYISKKFKDSTSTVDATYSVIAFGYGARIYLTYWGDYGSTHGFFNAYLSGELDYYIASRASDLLGGLGSPQSYAGFGGSAGGGVELAFGPNTTGFADIQYLKTSINPTSGTQFPLDGIIINVGTRLAFI